MKTHAALAATALAAASLSLGCQSTPQEPRVPLTPEEIARQEQERRIQAAHQRQALVELVRVLEIQLDQADGEVGRLQSTMSMGASFLEMYNAAYDRREAIRAQLEEARTQLNTLSD